MTDQIIGMFVGATFGLALGILITVSRSHLSSRRIEARLNLLLKNAGIDPEAAAMTEVTALARSGKKIEAIKAMRELTGCGLAEAKAKVEALMAECPAS